MADTLLREAIAYGSQPLSPVPQYWDGSSYAKVQGANGAIREINYNSSGTEIFTATTPASVKLTATSTVVISGTGTINFSGSGTVVISGTSTVNYSGSGTVEIVFSAGGSAVFSSTNPGNAFTAALVGGTILYSGSATWTSGETATGSKTLTVSALGTNTIKTTSQVFATTDGPYASSLDIYKNFIVGTATYTTSSVLTLTIPSEKSTANVTINSVQGGIAGLFSANGGLTIRLTITAAITSQMTNLIYIREAY